jgi:hypothetical protein
MISMNARLSQHSGSDSELQFQEGGVKGIMSTTSRAGRKYSRGLDRTNDYVRTHIVIGGDSLIANSHVSRQRISGVELGQPRETGPRDRRRGIPASLRKCHPEGS